MSRKTKKWVCFFLVVIIVAGICYVANPFLRVKVFIILHHEKIEAAMEDGHGVPFLGYKSVNSWPGDHPMTEFILFALGDTYYGCYYSPDDEPMAFQNVPVVLTQNGHEYWVWQAEGDNHGATQRIRENWFYFKASY